MFRVGGNRVVTLRIEVVFIVRRYQILLVLGLGVEVYVFEVEVKFRI